MSPDILETIKCMRDKKRLKLIAAAASARLRALDAAERKKEWEEKVAKDPRYKLDSDHRDHPSWDKQRHRAGWPGPGWVWGRRGWRQLGVYDG